MRKNITIIAILTALVIVTSFAGFSDQESGISHVNVIYNPHQNKIYVHDGNSEPQVVSMERKDDGERRTVMVLNEWGEKGFYVSASSSNVSGGMVMQRHYTLVKK